MANSLSGILNTAASGLRAHQAAITVTSQNITNAETEGYSRQRVVMSASTPITYPHGTFGTGVTIHEVTRIRDTLYDATYRAAAGDAAGSALRRDLLGEVEGVLGEPSDQGLAASMDAFWSSWSDLANTPGSGSARIAVQQTGNRVAGMLNDFADRLTAQGASIQTRLANAVGDINQLTSQVAAMNGQIVAAEVGGNPAPDLRDARDRLIDQLAQIVPVRTVDQPGGAQAVMIGGITMVDGTTAKALAVKAGPPIGVGLTTDAAGRQGLGGTIGAMLDVLNTDLPAVQRSLDELAAGLVSTVNAMHAQGPGGTDFFDASQATARTIRLDAAIAADASLIDATYAADPVTPARDNGLAIDMAALRDRTAVVGTLSFAQHYRQTVTSLGLAVNAADSAASVDATLASQADQRRQSVSGVSMDEEMVSLINEQHAYAAAARVVTTVDEMLQAILNMV